MNLLAAPCNVQAQAAAWIDEMERLAPFLKRDDPAIAEIYPGVRQDHCMREYEVCRMKDGSMGMVEYHDERYYELSKGSFGHNTLYVIAVDADGSRHRAGGAYEV